MKLSHLALAISLAPTLALADAQQALEIPPLVVTRATPIQQTTPASVKVIDRKQIEASGASALVDVLRGRVS